MDFKTIYSSSKIWRKKLQLHKKLLFKNICKFLASNFTNWFVQKKLLSNNIKNQMTGEHAFLMLIWYDSNSFLGWATLLNFRFLFYVDLFNSLTKLCLLFVCDKMKKRSVKSWLILQNLLIYFLTRKVFFPLFLGVNWAEVCYVTNKSSAAGIPNCQRPRRHFIHLPADFRSLTCPHIAPSR